MAPFQANKKYPTGLDFFLWYKPCEHPKDFQNIFVANLLLARGAASRVRVICYEVSTLLASLHSSVFPHDPSLDVCLFVCIWESSIIPAAELLVVDSLSPLFAFLVPTFFFIFEFLRLFLPSGGETAEFITIDLYSLWNCSQVQLTASHAYYVVDS